MNSEVIFDETQDKLLIGTRLLARAVGTSLGPLGNNMGLDYGHSVTTVHDGVTIAQAIHHKDLAVNFGIRVLREACNKQVAAVGDGTTAVAILGNAIFEEAHKNIVAGTNAMSLRKGLEEGRDLLLKELHKHVTPIKTKAQAVHIATISAEDDELGRQIGELIFDTGVDGVVTVEETHYPVTEIVKQEGMQFDKGYAHPYFITDPVRAEATIEDTFVLVSDKNVVNINELLPLFQEMEKEKLPKNIVIIAPDVTDSALASLLVNKARGVLNISCVKAPYSGQQQKDLLDDIAVLTGAQVVSNDAGMRFENTTLEMLGTAKRITSTKDATLIVGGQGDKKLIEDRVKQLRAEQDRDEGSEYQREKIRERIGKLTSGISVVKVGGATEVETKERLERAKDAVAATQAALKEGIVPGGEIIYLQIRKTLRTILPMPTSYSILYNALEKPFVKLLENAGMKPDAYIPHLQKGEGVDVVKGIKVQMVEAGIIDPTLVPAEAITNAVSTAVQLMITKGLILPLPEEPHGK